MRFPSEPPHRISRRRLGRGQYATAPPVATIVSGAGTTAAIQFSRPVFIKGQINLTIASLHAISQVVIDPQTVEIQFNATVNGRQWLLPTPPTNVATLTGSAILGGSGKLGGTMPITADDIYISDGTMNPVGGRGSIAADNSVSLAAGAFTIDPSGNVGARSLNLPLVGNVADALINIETQIFNQGNTIAALQNDVSALQAQLAAGATGSSTPGSGNVTTTGGIVTALT